MVSKIWVNIGSGNGLVPDGTKPLPEAMMNNGNENMIIKLMFTKYISLSFM